MLSSKFSYSFPLHSTSGLIPVRCNKGISNTQQIQEFNHLPEVADKYWKLRAIMTNTVLTQPRLLKMQIMTWPFWIWLTPGSANSSLENMTEDVEPPSTKQDPHCLSEVGNGSTEFVLNKDQLCTKRNPSIPIPESLSTPWLSNFPVTPPVQARHLKYWLCLQTKTGLVIGSTNVTSWII